MMKATLKQLLGRGSLPARWIRPVVKSVLLPAHADLSRPFGP